MSSVRTDYFARLATLPPISSPLRHYVVTAGEELSPSLPPLADAAPSEPWHSSPPQSPPYPLEEQSEPSNTVRRRRACRRRASYQLRIIAISTQACKRLPEETEDDEDNSASIAEANIESNMLRNEASLDRHETEEYQSDSSSYRDFNTYDGDEDEDQSWNNDSDDNNGDGDDEQTGGGSDHCGPDGEQEAGELQYDNGSLALVAQAALFNIESPPVRLNPRHSTWGSLTVPVEAIADQNFGSPPAIESENSETQWSEEAIEQNSREDWRPAAVVRHHVSAERMARRPIAPLKRRRYMPWM